MRCFDHIAEKSHNVLQKAQALMLPAGKALTAYICIRITFTAYIQWC